MKKIIFSIDGIDANSFSILGRFQRAARKQGRSSEEIKAVLKEAMSSDYHNLINTVLKYSNEEGYADEEEE